MAGKKKQELTTVVTTMLPGQASADSELVDALAAQIRTTHRVGGVLTGLRIGQLVLDGMFDGNVDNFLAAEKGHESFRALAGRDDLGFSASNLWYMVAMHANVRLLGDDAQKLDTSHHRLLVHVKDEDTRKQLAETAIEKDLTVRQLDELIKATKHREPDAPKVGRKPFAPALKQFTAIERSVDALKVVTADSVAGLSAEDGADLLARMRMTLATYQAWVAQVEAKLGKSGRDESAA